MIWRTRTVSELSISAVNHAGELQSRRNAVGLADEKAFFPCHRSSEISLCERSVSVNYVYARGSLFSALFREVDPPAINHSLHAHSVLSASPSRQHLSVFNLTMTKSLRTRDCGQGTWCGGLRGLMSHWALVQAECERGKWNKKVHFGLKSIIFQQTDANMCLKNQF